MILWIADDHDNAAELVHQFPFRHGVGRLVGTLRVKIRPDRIHQFFDGRLVKYCHQINAAKRSDDLRAFILRHKGSVLSLQFSCLPVRIDTHNEYIAYRLCSFQISDMADVEEVEAAVRKHDLQAF